MQLPDVKKMKEDLEMRRKDHIENCGGRLRVSQKKKSDYLSLSMS